MRYYIKCKLNPDGRKKLVDSIKSGNLAKGKIFYEGMQAALREAAIDEKDVVHSGRWPISNGNGIAYIRGIF